jgi:peroxiredoxin
MKTSFSGGWWVAVASTVVALVGISLLRARADSTPGAKYLETRFKQLDKNGDGKLTREEAHNAPWFDKLDRGSKGYITIEDVRFFGILAAALSGAGEKQFPASLAAGTAAESPRQGPKLLKASEHGVGRLVPDVKFTDLDGQPGKLSDYHSSHALVIAYTGTSCPIARKYANSLSALEKEFQAKGFSFLFINPTATDSPEDIRASLKDHALAGRYVRDLDRRVTAALGAQSSTEILVLDPARTLVFRGAVDDQYGLGYSLDVPRQNFLKDALTATLAGRPPMIAATEAPGCALEVKAHPAMTADVTYHNRISRIVQNNCLECHHQGGVGPFSLATYDDLKAHGPMMVKQVNRGLMPPWFAAPGQTGEPSHWANDRSLSTSDRADLLTWLAGDKPLGNPADAPVPRRFSSQWTIGEPDAIFQLPRAMAIKADGVMPYQVVTVETSFPDDRWVSAYEIMPTAREVVHHVIVRVHEHGTKVSEHGEGGEGGEGYWAAYVPGNAWRIYPEGFGKKLPAGATFSFQIHYTPNGKATQDQLRIGLKFASEPPKYAVHVLGLPKHDLNIPPGEPNHVETMEQRIPFDLNVTALMAHMHVRGKAFKYEVKYPDGRWETLLDLPHYDFNWQLRYECAETKRIPAGSTMKLTAVFDNSRENPANPDPNQMVHWGPQTFNEMMIGYVECYTDVNQKLDPGIRHLARAKKSTL